LLRTLMAYLRGEPRVVRIVRVPSEGGQRRLSAVPSIDQGIFNGGHASLCPPYDRILSSYFVPTAVWIAFQSNFSASAIASSSVRPL
jgi:hypothetical protein